jgi:uncharacterized protein
MMLDLSEIVVREGMRVRLDVDQPSVEDPDLVFAGPITGQLRFENSGEVINIGGSTRCTLTVPCARCLVDVLLPIEFELEEHLPIDDVLHPDRPPDKDSEWETVISSIVHLDQGRPILDLDELLRQWIVSEVPMCTVCSEDCRGLCPHCGANQNETSCNCAETQRHTPLAGLAQLLEKRAGSADS